MSGRPETISHAYMGRMHDNQERRARNGDRLGTKTSLESSEHAMLRCRYGVHGPRVPVSPAIEPSKLLQRTRRSECRTAFVRIAAAVSSDPRRIRPVLVNPVPGKTGEERAAVAVQAHAFAIDEARIGLARRE